MTCETLLVSTRADSQPVRLESGCVVSENFSPDGTMVATGNSWQYTIAVFDVETGEGLVEFENPVYDGWSMASTPDGAELIVGSFAAPVNVFDIESLTSGDPLGTALRLTIPAHDGLVLGVVPSPDGSMLSGSALHPDAFRFTRSIPTN